MARGKGVWWGMGRIGGEDGDICNSVKNKKVNKRKNGAQLYNYLKYILK